MDPAQLVERELLGVIGLAIAVSRARVGSAGVDSDGTRGVARRILGSYAKAGNHQRAPKRQ